MIRIEINGEEFLEYTSLEIEDSMDSLCSSFKMESIVKIKERIYFPCKLNDNVLIFNNDELLFNGYIESLDYGVSVDNSGNTTHNINVSGRNKLGDLVDSYYVGKINGKDLVFNKGTDLKTAIKKVLEYLNLNDLSVLSYVATKPITSDQTNVEYGNSLFVMIDHFARKQQVLITSNERNNIVLTRNVFNELPLTLKRGANFNDSNIISLNFKSDNNTRFNNIVVGSQDISEDIQDKQATIGNLGSAKDENIRNSRILWVHPSISLTKRECVSMAQWEVATRKARAITIECILVGSDYTYKEDKTNSLNFQNLLSSKNISKFSWRKNNIIRLKDEYLNIDNKFLIKKVVFRKSIEGETTTLELVDKNSFLIETSLKKSARKKSNEEDFLIL